ncbi:MAG: DJ-1/PfpI family protein [Gammaproteobacteria bacterium]|nr:DJ-1/PfpI family protein [Gammaproteobacteria bacterium]
MSDKMNVGIYVFEGMTMLDGYAPLQILSFVEQFNTFTFSKEGKAVRSDSNTVLTPDYGFDDCPPLDILVMPGGGDVFGQMSDATVQAFLKDSGAKAKYITSVCTGALILAEAGLLDGHRATTHWAYIDQLAKYPEIEVVDERVAVDRNRISGGGITAGLDFALTVVAEVVSPELAQTIQLIFEYRPQPPFNTGSPETAPAEIVERVKGMVAERNQPLYEHLANK